MSDLYKDFRRSRQTVKPTDFDFKAEIKFDMEGKTPTCELIIPVAKDVFKWFKKSKALNLTNEKMLSFRPSYVYIKNIRLVVDER